MEAKARGATVIHVDPRFTRTSALADLYEGLEVQAASGERDQQYEDRAREASVRQAARGEAHGSGGADVGAGNPERDETLQHPRCVFQILKRHFARYTPEMVEQMCGVPTGSFRRVCELLTEAGALLGRAGGGRGRTICALAGASLLAASAATRWGVFHAGLASAADPKYTVVPQRERRDARQREPAAAQGREQAGADGREQAGTHRQETA
jgi:anaerobic selenocysteine-containing dehydrogenase